MKDETDLLRVAEVYHRNERNGAPLLKLANGIAAKLFTKKPFLLHLLRVVTKSTKAHKQWNAAQTLLSIGLKTPAPICVEVFDGKGHYEASFMYDFLEAAEPMHEALQSRDRKELLTKLANELAIMYRAGVLFIDFHLGNVLVDSDGNLWWIDPEFTYSRKKMESTFWQRMERMHHKCNIGVLSEIEWTYLKAKLRYQISH